MSGKKKLKKPREKKGGKYDITVAIDATFDDLLKSGLNPPPAKVKKEG